MHIIQFIEKHWIIILIVVIILAGVAVWYFFFYNPIIDAGDLRTSVTEQNALKQEEGYKPAVYADTGGVLTGGYGHTGPDVDALGLGAPVSTDLAVQWFNSDLNKFEEQLNSILPDQVLADIDQNQWDALIDFLWNTGATTSTLFTSYVDNEDWAGAANFLETHYTTDSAGHTLAGLITRRDNEATEITS